MPPPQMVNFIRNDVMPSWWANAIQRALSAATSNLRVIISAAQVRVPASAAEPVILSIDGKWRWIEADVVVASPGGAAGNLVLYVTATDNAVDNVPQPGTDHTDYSFGLELRAAGVPATPLYRAIADVEWGGAAFTGKITSRVDAPLLVQDVLQLVMADARWSDQRTPKDASVTLAKMAFDVATQAELDAAVAAFNTSLGLKQDASSAATDAEMLAAINAVFPVGSQMFTSRVTLPATSLGIELAWADGSLIDRTTYATFFAEAGHAYNGGVDPGSNKVRLPDKRGRGSMGAADMGGPAGSASNVNSRAQGGRGAVGGEVTHQTVVSEMPVHGHGVTDPGHLTHMWYAGGPTNGTGNQQNVGSAQWSVNAGINFVGGPFWYAVQQSERDLTGVSIQNQGGGGSHNNMQPFETDRVYVRIK